MPNFNSFASTQPVGAPASSAKFVRRIVICSVQSTVNAGVIARFAPVLYRSTIHDPLRQAVVTLLFVALLGSLARMWFVALATRQAITDNTTFTRNSQKRGEPRCNQV